MAKLAAQPTHRYRGSVKTLSSLSRVNLLRELQENGPQNISQLAEASGLHTNTAREHLQLLIRAGYVRSESIHVTRKGRPQLRYRAAVPSDIITTRAAGHQPPTTKPRVSQPRGSQPPHADGANLKRQLDALSSHLNVCGFAATLQPGADHMTLRDCPFADLARDNPQVCEMHHALVRGTLDAANGPLHAPQLHPFTDTNECTLDLDAHNTRGGAEAEANSTKLDPPAPE